MSSIFEMLEASEKEAERLAPVPTPSYDPLGTTASDELIAEFEKRAYTEFEKEQLGQFRNSTPNVQEVGVAAINYIRARTTPTEWEAIFNIFRATAMRARPTQDLDPRFCILGTAGVATTRSGFKESVFQFMQRAAAMATFGDDGSLRSAPMGFWKTTHSGQSYQIEIWHFGNEVPIMRNITSSLPRSAILQNTHYVELWAKRVAADYLKNHEITQPEEFTPLMHTMFEFDKVTDPVKKSVVQIVTIRIKDLLYKEPQYRKEIPADILAFHNLRIDLRKFVDEQLKDNKDLEYWIDQAQPTLFEKLRKAFNQFDAERVKKIKTLYAMAYKDSVPEIRADQGELAVNVGKRVAAGEDLKPQAAALRALTIDVAAKSWEATDDLQKRRIRDAPKPREDYNAKRCLSIMPSTLDGSAAKLEYVLHGHEVKGDVCMVSSGKEPTAVHMVAQLCEAEHLKLYVPVIDAKQIQRLKVDQLAPIMMDKSPAEYVSAAKESVLVYDYAVPYELRADKDRSRVVKTWTRYQENAVKWSSVIAAYLANPNLRSAVIKTYLPGADAQTHMVGVVDEYQKVIGHLCQTGRLVAANTPQLHNAEFYLIHRKGEVSGGEIREGFVRVLAQIFAIATVVKIANAERQKLMIFGNRLVYDLEKTKLDMLSDLKNHLPNSFNWKWLKQRYVPPIDQEMMRKQSKAKEGLIDADALLAERSLFETPAAANWGDLEAIQLPAFRAKDRVVRSETEHPGELEDQQVVFDEISGVHTNIDALQLAQRLQKKTGRATYWTKKKVNRNLYALEDKGMVVKKLIDDKPWWSMAPGYTGNENVSKPSPSAKSYTKDEKGKGKVVEARASGESVGRGSEEPSE